MSNDVVINEELQRMRQEAWNRSKKAGETIYAKWVEKAKKDYYEAFGREMSGYQIHNLVTALANTESDFNKLFGREEVSRFLCESTTTPTSIGKFINQAFEMVTALLPVNIMDKFTSIQTLDRRTGEVFYMNIKKGQNKGTANTADENYMGALDSPRNTDNYSSQEIVGALSFTQDGSTVSFPGTITNYVPITAATLKYTLGSTAYEIVGVLSGSNITFTGTGISSAVLTTAGSFTCTFSTAPAVATTISVDIEYNMVQEDGYVNDVYANLETITLTAKPYKLNMRWLIDAAMMIDREHGIDLEKEFTEKVVSGMQNERAVAASKALYSAASALAANVISFDTKPPSDVIAEFIHIQSFGYNLAKGTKSINKAIRFANANFLIGGLNTISLFEGLPKDQYKAATYEGKKPAGMHVAGAFQNYDIIENLDFGDEEFVVGANMGEMLYSGSVYGEFIPVTVLNPMWNRSSDAFKSAIAYNTFKILNANFYKRGRVYKST